MSTIAGILTLMNRISPDSVELSIKKLKTSGPDLLIGAFREDNDKSDQIEHYATFHMGLRTSTCFEVSVLQSVNVFNLFAIKVAKI